MAHPLSTPAPSSLAHDDVLETADAWRRDGRQVALATVVSTWGSAPRPVGSQLAIDTAGAMAGSVSGGCIEGAVVREAQAVIASGRPQLLEYGVSNEQAWEVGLACGGTVRVLVERLADRPDPGESVGTVLQARARKQPLAVVTRLEGGGRHLVYGNHDDGDLPLDPAQLAEIRTRMRDDRSGTIAEGRLFVHVHNPTPRLIIVGAVHISQALAPIAAIAGYAVAIIDPRQAFATTERFPGVQLCDDWPDEAMQALAPDARTAVVTLTHDPKLDDPALEVALQSDAFYIASLGSRRTHAARLDRLRALGFDEAALARIHGPAGLPIGAASPAEIAVAVMAQMTAARHGRALALAA